MSGALTRRQLIAACGVAFPAGGLLAAPLKFGMPLLIDTSLLDHAQRPALSDAPNVIALTDNLPRQWRDCLRAEILAHHGATALVRWDKALLLKGLAREAGFQGTTRPRPSGVFHLMLRT